jgi:NAD(P)H-flavin reductase
MSVDPVDPVTGPIPVGRPVPGSYPEPPSPAQLEAAMRMFAAPQVSGVRPARPGPLVDGMNPADDAALRQMQRLLGDSLALAGGTEQVAGRLRAALAQALPQLLTVLPGGPQTQREQFAQALVWLLENLDQPPALVAGCGLLGAALAECGVHAPQLQLVGAALAEAMRAGMAAGAWRQDFDQAWRTTWQHVSQWIGHGEAQTLYRPTLWTATVVAHEARRDDLAIIRLRPFLPMPFRPGQYARIEVSELPGVWRPYSLAGAPRRDNLVELHVRAKTESGVSGTLVYRTQVGDHVRLTRAEGAMGLPEHADRNLLLIAGDTGVAPLKAVLTEMAATGDPRTAVLFWGVRTLDELYDIEEIAQIARACRRATVVPVISEGEAGPYASGLVTDAVAAYGEWSNHEVYLAGPPVMLAATSAALRLLGVASDHIHHDPPG